MCIRNLLGLELGLELEVWMALEVDRMLVEVEQGSGDLREEMTLEQRLEGSLNADSPASLHTLM